MNKADLTTVAWRKSSYSGDAGNCVEIAATGEAVAIRDSKDPQGSALQFTPAAFADFLAAVTHDNLR
ncbi:DUF397 domain-containing protein [Actinacidiphila yeochonensis]|uniref:DUF397 domain-containing protein n=1 Tax=Actinacidiphila yeochonensis TaxID=89050 RepID=UPI000567A7B8|nr:DUF397 domain-containing protein [Actinacidiphila yeochonensis]